MKEDFRKFLKKLLRGPYHKLGLGVKWDRLLIKDLSEYFSLSKKETIFYLKKATKLNADLWKTFNPKNEQEIREFYSFTPYSIFSLAYWHMKRYQRDFRKKLVKYAYGHTLDYGGGIGDLSIELAKKGLSVSYADVEGKTFEFAKWLFKENNLVIPMIDLNKENLTQHYDTVICIDVIEHVSDPGLLLRDIGSHIKKGGSLIITNLQVEEILEDYPMHFKVEFDAKEYLRSLGFQNKEFPWLWIKY